MQVRDSKLVTFVREGEAALEGLRHNAVAKRGLGVALLVLAALLFVPPWFLIPGLVFAGLSLLDLRPFRFGGCGLKSRASEE